MMVYLRQVWSEGKYWKGRKRNGDDTELKNEYITRRRKRSSSVGVVNQDRNDSKSYKWMNKKKLM